MPKRAESPASAVGRSTSMPPLRGRTGPVSSQEEATSPRQDKSILAQLNECLQLVEDLRAVILWIPYAKTKHESAESLLHRLDVVLAELRKTAKTAVGISSEVPGPTFQAGAHSSLTLVKQPEHKQNITSSVTIELYNQIANSPGPPQDGLNESITAFRVTDPSIGSKPKDKIILRMSRDGMFFLGDHDGTPAVFPLFRIKNEQFGCLENVYSVPNLDLIAGENQAVITSIAQPALCERYDETDWRLIRRGELTVQSVASFEKRTTNNSEMPEPLLAAPGAHHDRIVPPHESIRMQRDLIRYYNKLMLRATTHFDNWVQQCQFQRLSVSDQQLKKLSRPGQSEPVEFHATDGGVLFLSELEGVSFLFPSMILSGGKRKRVSACFKVEGPRSVIDGEKPWHVEYLSEPAIVTPVVDRWQLLKHGVLTVRALS